MNKFSTLHIYETTDLPIYWNSQPPSVHSKSRTSPTQTSPLVSAIMERLNHHDVDNGDVEVHPPDYPFEFTS